MAAERMGEKDAIPSDGRYWPDEQKRVSQKTARAIEYLRKNENEKGGREAKSVEKVADPPEKEG